MKGMLLTALVSMLGLVPGTLAQQAPPAPEPAAAADMEAARKLYVSYGCYQCHGYEAQGSSATGPKLGPRPLPFAAFSAYVRRPAGQMPLYTTEILPDADLEQIYAYVESRPAPLPVERIPLLLQ